jgi:hypothetical protein
MTTWPPVFTFDVDAFRIQFPAFANPTQFPDLVLEQYWDAATCYVSPVNEGALKDGCRLFVLNLYTAHLTALSVIIARGTTTGQVQSATVDKASVTFTPPPEVTQYQWWMNLTPYGQQAYALLQQAAIGGDYVGGWPERSAIRKAYGVF